MLNLLIAIIGDTYDIVKSAEKEVKIIFIIFYKNYIINIK